MSAIDDLLFDPIAEGKADTPDAPIDLTLAELTKLSAVDSEFYARTFFPKTFRQASPPFAKMMWEPLEDPHARLVNLICFRGSSKTTRLRTFASKRIAYGVSRTILYIGVSERDAIRSVSWLRNQVERNKLWRETFKLKPGKKWEETQIEIEHEGFSQPDAPHTIWVLAAGITGSLRGINFDDYRPDLIVVDDPQTDEMASNELQREKINDLILSAVRNSLAPRSEEPNAKLVMAATPQHQQDVTQRALVDPEWVSRVIPCWTMETLDHPVDRQMSSWEERFPSTDLRSQKKSALRRNKLSEFSKELECKVVAKESASFLTSWLNIRQGPPPFDYDMAVLGIDPVPPPSERQMQKALEQKDWEVHHVWGRRPNGEYHLLESARNKGHDPSWSTATAFGLMRRWRCARMVFDAVAYQRTLKWIFEQEMKAKRIWFQIVPIADGMKKFTRINTVLNGLATNGLLWIGPEHTEFAEQFEHYGPLYQGFDDDIDAAALTLQDLSNPYLDGRAPGAMAEIESNPFVARSP